MDDNIAKLIFGYIDSPSIIRLALHNKTPKEIESLLNPYVYMVKCSCCVNIITSNSLSKCNLCRQTICNKCIVSSCDKCKFHNVCSKCFKNNDYYTDAEFLEVTHPNRTCLIYQTYTKSDLYEMLN
jgi:hypothetical protein